MDYILKTSTFILLCLFGIPVRIADVCTPALQRCQNCFTYPPGECETLYTGLSEVNCIDYLNDLDVTVSAYNAIVGKCWHYTCEKTFTRSTINTTIIRMGGCGNGCSNITLIPYDDAKITSSATMQTISVSSHEECITLAVEMTFTGTDCNVVYSSSTGTCEVYTGCPKGGCPRSSAPSHQVEVVTCDSSVLCELLQTPVNGAVTTSKGYSTNSLATYSCNPGYGLVGTLHKTCNVNGVWSTADVPTCESAVNGSWGDWDSWSNCSSNCGIGTQIRTRYCDNPAPAYGGDICIGSDTESQSCNGTMCPVNGSWGGWKSWSNCSSNCGIGTQIRTRYCDNPAPAYGGNDCIGSHTDIQSCNGTLCPVNGSWGGWESWSNCSSNCGIGTQIRTRYCDNPAPAYGGDICIGSDTDSQSCNGTMCPGTVPTTHVPRKLYIRSCFCSGNSTFQGMAEDEIVQQLVKDTKIDEKTTVLAHQKLKCTEDLRQSSKVIGSVGVAIISAIFGLIVLIDCMSLYQWVFHSDNNQDK